MPSRCATRDRAWSSAAPSTTRPTTPPGGTPHRWPARALPRQRRRRGPGPRPRARRRTAASTRFDEPFGLSVVEAMACGTPVVGYRRGALPEIVADGVSGFLVDDIAEAVAAVPRALALDRTGVAAAPAAASQPSHGRRIHHRLRDHAQLGAPATAPGNVVTPFVSAALLRYGGAPSATRTAARVPTSPARPRPLRQKWSSR